MGDEVRGMAPDTGRAVLGWLRKRDLPVPKRAEWCQGEEHVGVFNALTFAPWFSRLGFKYCAPSWFYKILKYVGVLGLFSSSSHGPRNKEKHSLVNRILLR